MKEFGNSYPIPSNYIGFDVDTEALEKAYIADLQAMTPIHPITGEKGTFQRFAKGQIFIRPIYRTPSGQEFLLPTDNSEALLEEAGVEWTSLDEDSE